MMGHRSVEVSKQCQHEHVKIRNQTVSSQQSGTYFLKTRDEAPAKKWMLFQARIMSNVGVLALNSQRRRNSQAEFINPFLSL